MQSIQRKILALCIAIALFSSVAFADGEMGGGGLWGNEPAQTKVVVTSSDDRQTTNTAEPSEDEFSLDWLINSVAELLGLND